MVDHYLVISQMRDALRKGDRDEFIRLWSGRREPHPTIEGVFLHVDGIYSDCPRFIEDIHRYSSELASILDHNSTIEYPLPISTWMLQGYSPRLPKMVSLEKARDLFLQKTQEVIKSFGIRKKVRAVDNEFVLILKGNDIGKLTINNPKLTELSNLRNSYNAAKLQNPMPTSDPILLERSGSGWVFIGGYVGCFKLYGLDKEGVNYGLLACY